MWRERALKVVLLLVGLLFSAGVYPLVVMLRQEPALAMMMSLYVTLGVFLIMAARDPSANRSLIGFTAWSSLAHAVVMGLQAFRNMIARGELFGVAALVIIGIALIVLAPAKSSAERTAAAAHAHA
jgi:hypothetical protein